MGHSRLGLPPTTRKWTSVVSLVTGGGTEVGGPLLSEDVAKIATQALDAAEAALKRAISDEGLRYSFYLLTQLVLAARKEDWHEQLAKLGIHLSANATLFDLTAEIQNAIDDHIASYGHRSDVSEMAQQAAGEAVATLAGPRAMSLFGSDKEQLRRALHALSTKKGFAELGQRFFGRFVSYFLNFYLSRITAAQLGKAQLPQVGELSRFNEVLKIHCEQSARIVRDFCGEWYSKTEFREGISLDNTSRFMAVALEKLQAELRRQRGTV